MAQVCRSVGWTTHEQGTTGIASCRADYEALRLRHATAGDVRCLRASEMARQRLATIGQIVLNRSVRGVSFAGSVCRIQIRCKHEAETVTLVGAIDRLLRSHNV